MITLERAQPSDSIIEEVACLDMELLTIENEVRRLEARRVWVRLLRENFRMRFEDFCA